MDRLTRYLTSSPRGARTAGAIAAALLIPLIWSLFRDGAQVPLTLELFSQRFELARPHWLLLALLGLPYLLFTMFASLTAEPLARRAVLTAGRGLMLALLALGLAQPSVHRASSELSVVALLDVSASVTDTALDKQRRFAHALTQAVVRQKPAPTFRLVRFASHPEELPLGLEAAQEAPVLDRFSGEEGQETDLGQALALGLGLLEPGRVARLVIVGDGRPTKGDALAQAERARSRGARIYYHLPAGREEPDIAITALEAPEVVRPGASFDLEVKLLSTVAASARLRLFKDGQPHRPDAERALTLSPGLNEIRWPTRLDTAAPALFHVELAEANENAHPENDAAMLAVVPAPRPRVLVLEQPVGSTAPFRRALAAEQIDSDALRPGAFPDPSQLERYDLVVLSNLPRGALRDGDLRALEAQVRDGGGLLVASGPDGFGSGAYAGTRLEGLLPLKPNNTDERQEATLALALVIDRSGSMSGPKMELTKEAARSTAEMLAPQDLITVVVFDSQAQTVVRLQPASNRQRILGDIAQIRASGGTNILPGLREAFEQLLVARARKKHVIVLSDGQSPVEGLQELVDDAAAARITVSAVGVGEGADLAVLQMIASRGGGRFYHTRDPSTIPRIFTREAAQFSHSSVVEESTAAVVGKASQALAGIPFETAPPLRGYTRAQTRPEADVLLISSQGDPLLARWQQGLGQVLVWTSDLSTRWSADWVRWGGYNKLWGQVARSAMRHQAANHFPIRAELHGDRVLARIDALGADDQPLAGLVGDLEVTDLVDPMPRAGLRGEAGGGKLGGSAEGFLPKDPTRRLAFSERRPGRYEVELPLDGARALLLSARLRLPGESRPIAHATGRLALPPARELLPPLPLGPGSGGTLAQLAGRPLLEALAARTGGQELSGDPGPLLAPGEDRITSRRPLRPLVLLLALVVFLSEITIRRVKFRGLGRGSLAG
jgi:Ca-activated chloride channel homolog